MVMYAAWHEQSTRPITRGDIGRLVVGYGCGGFAAGFVEEMRSGLLVIDTGKADGSLNGNVIVEAIDSYTFVEAPEAQP